jgi:putative cell wall-binding protein
MTILFVSVLIFSNYDLSFSSASSFNAEREQKIRQVLNLSQNNPLVTSKQVTYVNPPVATQASYVQNIDDYHLHEYFFATNGGEFEVFSQHNDEAPIDYIIYHFGTDEIVQPIEGNSYQLEQGAYYFAVFGYSDLPVPYEFQLNGPFSEQPSATLPSLQLSKPSSHNIRLPKGSSPVFPITGSTSDAYHLRLEVNYDQVFDLPVPGAFSGEYAVLGNGFNEITFTATRVGGNQLTSFHNIILPGVTRIMGSDRYAVSGNVSSTLNHWGFNSGTIVIARGDLYPDALSGGALAYLEDAPILLTKTASLPDIIIRKINDLGAERAIILGGLGSVSENVENQLFDLGIMEIERYEGKDRYEVSANIAEEVSYYSETDTAIIASGMVFPDALSASTLSGPMGMPILLTRTDSVPDSIQMFIKDHPEITNFIVVGGPATVNEAVLSKIKNIRPGAAVARIGGKNRYEVSVNVAKYAMNYYGLELGTVAVARGDLFPDALSGAPLANYFGAPILLTPTSKVDETVNSFLMNNRSQLEHIYILGGTGSVSTTTENQLFNLIR